MTRLIIVTGAAGFGKTKLISALVSKSVQAGVCPVGFLSIGQGRSAGQAESFDLVPLPAGERVLLAHRYQDLGGPRVGHFSFSTAAIAAGQEILHQAALQRVTLLIADEIGPLELLQQQGFTAIFPAISAGPLTAVVAIRQSLINTFLERSGLPAYLVISASDPAADSALWEAIDSSRSALAES